MIAKTSHLWLAVVAIGTLAVCSSASAQFTFPTSPQGVGMYRAEQQPNQQTLSPYLNLLRDDRSVLSPYHTFVVPRQQQRQMLSMQEAQIRTLERSASQRSNVTQRTRAMTGRGGYFQSYLHFYAPAK